MKTSIVIVTFNKLEYTKKCIESIRKYTNSSNYKTVIVDNNSTDGTVQWLNEQKDLRVILNKENLGFPKGCNVGINASDFNSDILLLNNDTIVTENWLNNLIKCLYSADNIGAVGPVTNSPGYYQNIETNYKNEDELQVFASKFNISDKDKWEERQKLIGFCMLIKREAINKIGLLDEAFTPGNFEDDDYCIRLLNEGYKIYLCNDTFIHHYGGISFNRDKKYRELIERNNNIFQKKWGFTSKDHMSIYRRYVEFIDNENMNILEMFCGTGANILYLKQKIKGNYYGFEDNLYAEKIAKNYFTTLSLSDIEQTSSIFDLVIINDVEKINNVNLQNVLNKSKKFIINISAYQESEESLNSKIDKIILSFPINIFVLSDGIKELDEKTGKIIRLYLIYENKSYKEIEESLINIDKGIDVEQEFLKLLNYIQDNYNNLEIILKLIERSAVNKVDILNSLGVLCYENEKLMENVIAIFNEALKYEEDNYEVLMKYSEVVYNLGQYEIALSHMSKIKEKDTHWKELNEKILEKRNFERSIRFLLRRLEFKIDEDESKEELVKLIVGKQINEDMIMKIVDNDIIDKVYLLNYVVIKAFENEQYDIIIPLLNKAYDLNPQNIDTNYNLAYILNLMGEKSIALEYLYNLKERNDTIEQLMKVIEGEK